MTNSVTMVAISGAHQVSKIMLQWGERHTYLCDDRNSILIGAISQNNFPGPNDQRHPYAVLKRMPQSINKVKNSPFEQEMTLYQQNEKLHAISYDPMRDSRKGELIP